MVIKFWGSWWGIWRITGLSGFGGLIGEFLNLADWRINSVIRKTCLPVGWFGNPVILM